MRRADDAVETAAPRRARPGAATWSVTFCGDAERGEIGVVEAGQHGHPEQLAGRAPGRAAARPRRAASPARPRRAGSAWRRRARAPARTAPATVFGMSWNLRSRNTGGPSATTRRTPSGPFAVTNSRPTLKPPTAPTSARPRRERAVEVGPVERAEDGGGLGHPVLLGRPAYSRAQAGCEPGTCAAASPTRGRGILGEVITGAAAAVQLDRTGSRLTQRRTTTSEGELPGPRRRS